MRVLLAATAALALSVSAALAGPLAPAGMDDGLEFGGMFDNSTPIMMGDTIQITGLRPNHDEARFMMGAGVLASAGAFELAGIEVASEPPFNLVLAAGAGNNAVSLNFDYDRSRVANHAFNDGLNDQIGILTATITSTLAAQITDVTTGPFTQRVLFIGGELQFDDGLGVYDPNMQGSWYLTSVFTDNDDIVTVSLSVSTREFQIPTVTTPEPSVIALLGAGVLGAGLLARRRR